MCGNVVRGGWGGWGWWLGGHKITSEKRQRQDGGWSHGDVREQKRGSEKKDKKMRGAFEM